MVPAEKHPNIVTSSVGMWSFKLLNSAYTGKCIRVQRQSDNAQTDISFSSGKCSKAEVDAFTAASTLRIIAFYDQSGVGNDLTASNSTAPKLFYDTYISNYSACFSCVTNSFFTMPAGVAVSTRNFSLYSVAFGQKNPATQTHYDFETNKLLYYQSSFNVQSVYDGSAHTNTNKYLAFSVDYNVFSLRGNATNVKENIDNLRETILYSSPIALTTTAGGSVGKWSGSGAFYSSFYWFGGIVYSTKVSDFLDEYLVSTLQQATGKSVAKTKCVIGLGDSMTFGVGATYQDSNWFTLLFRNENDQSLQFFNSGISGNTISNINSDLSNRCTSLINQGINYSNSVCIVWAGTNDILGGASGATTYANFTNLCNSIRAGGISKIIVVDILPRTDYSGAMETERQAFNSALSSNHSFADVYVQASASTWTGKFADAVHLNNSGHTQMAALIKTALDSVL